MSDKILKNNRKQQQITSERSGANDKKHMLLLTFLGTVEQRSFFFVALVDFDNACASKQLHNKTRCDNRWDTELHKSTAVRGKNHSHPVKRIRRVWRCDTIKWNLAANEVDEQRDGSPKQLFLERNLSIWWLHLWQNCHEGLYYVNKFETHCDAGYLEDAKLKMMPRTLTLPMCVCVVWWAEEPFATSQVNLANVTISFANFSRSHSAKNSIEISWFRRVFFVCTNARLVVFTCNPILWTFCIPFTYFFNLIF